MALAPAGSGTFADVWKVRDAASGRVFALKQLRPEWEQNGTARRLLENEAEIGQAVSSPWLVQFVDSQLQTLPRFLVLEWLEGETLDARLERAGALPCHAALWIARQCAAGLTDLHSAGFIHGDLKPSNVFVDSAGAVKLIDLGFARRIGATATEFSGTPELLAPEVLAGFPSTPARDLYSLGVLLYRMLAGRMPFTGETVRQVLRQQLELCAPQLRRLAPEIPADVASFVERLLSKQPLRRAANSRDVLQELLGLELAALSSEVRVAIADRNPERSLNGASEVAS